MERILLCKPKMSGRELDYIIPALREDWAVPLGPDVTAFEHDLEQYCNVPHAVALSSGTAALHLAILSLGVEPGDEVIVQSFTFCASVNPIVYCGASPVFIDSERDTWNMDPELLEQAITDRLEKTGKLPKCIIPVALYGMPYKIERILEIANRYNIPVVEDAAEGFGSRYNNKILGSFGTAGILSFNGNKMITTSGGGAVLCHSRETAEKIKWLATQARESYPYYEHKEIGFNYRLSNISACIGRAQMTVLEEYISHHRHIHSIYEELLNDVDGISLHCNPSDEFNSNFWLCTILISPDIRIIGEENAYSQKIGCAIGGAGGVTRAADTLTTDCQPNRNVEALRIELEKHGIESRPLWKPMHKQPLYGGAPAYINGISEELFSQGLCLPSGPYVKEEHVRYIVNTIRQAIQTK